MSELIERIAGMKLYCAGLHWRLWRVTPDGDPNPLFRITVPGPVGLWIVMNADSKDPRGMDVDELGKLLRVVRIGIHDNCVSDEEVWIYSGQDPDSEAIDRQYEVDKGAAGVEAVIPNFD